MHEFFVRLKHEFQFGSMLQIPIAEDQAVDRQRSGRRSSTLGRPIVDVPVDDAERALVDGIAGRGGLRRHEQHAEKMALRALREALGR